MKRKLWKIHHSFGLYAGIILIILSVTGALAVFKQEIDEFLNPNLYQVDNDGNTPHSFQEVYESFKPTRDSLLNAGHKEIDIKLPTDQYSPYIFHFFYKAPGVVKGILKDEQREYFIDPYTLVKVYRNRQQTFAHYIRSVHVHLYEFYLGRFITGFFGIALLITVITGFMIYGNFMKSIAFGKVRKRRARNKWADIHKFIGVITLFFNLIIAATGAWLGLESLIMAPFVENKKEILSPLDIEQKKKEIAFDESLSIDYTKIMHETKRQFPDLIPNYVVPSRDGSKTVTVNGNIFGYAYTKSSSNIVFDKVTGDVISKRDIRNLNNWDQLYFSQEALHYGDFGGVGLKIVYCIFGILTGFLSVSGYYLYYERQNNFSSYDVRKKMLKYSIFIISFLIFLYGITYFVNGGVAYLIVTLSFYVLIVTLLIRFTILYVLRRLKKKNG